MTDDMMNLRALVEKSADADLLREMTPGSSPRAFAAEKLMEMEVGADTGAAWGEKSPLRTAQRNGCRDRDWETRAGTVELRIPKPRKGSHVPRRAQSPRKDFHPSVLPWTSRGMVPGVPECQTISHDKRGSPLPVSEGGNPPELVRRLLSMVVAIRMMAAVLSGLSIDNP